MSNNSYLRKLINALMNYLIVEYLRHTFLIVGMKQLKQWLKLYLFLIDETKEGIEEVFEGVETFIVSLPTLYWVLIFSGVAFVIISVVVALCYIRYRKNRKYTMYANNVY